MKVQSAKTAAKPAEPARVEATDLAASKAILSTVAIVSEKRFRLDVELRHPR